MILNTYKSVLMNRYVVSQDSFIYNTCQLCQVFFILIPSAGYDKQGEESGFSEIHLPQEISIVMNILLLKKKKSLRGGFCS